MSVQHKVMLKVDQIKLCGKGAVNDFKRLCRDCGIESSVFSCDYTEAHLEVCEKVLKLWHTTKKFKVGDKVYVIPQTPTIFKYCIRAVVTEVGTDRWGYRLRAFEKDLPGIFMFNMWDKDLKPRFSKANKLIPKGLLIK